MASAKQQIENDQAQAEAIDQLLLRALQENVPCRISNNDGGLGSKIGFYCGTRKITAGIGSTPCDAMKAMIAASAKPQDRPFSWDAFKLWKIIEVLKEEKIPFSITGRFGQEGKHSFIAEAGSWSYKGNANNAEKALMAAVKSHYRNYLCKWHGHNAGAEKKAVEQLIALYG